MKTVLAVGNRVLAQSAERGAPTTLYAATAPNVEGGECYGPNGFQEMRGRPMKVNVSAAGRDPQIGQIVAPSHRR